MVIMFAQGHIQKYVKTPAHPKLAPSKFDFHLSRPCSLSSLSCYLASVISVSLTLSFFHFYLPEFCPENLAG